MYRHGLGLNYMGYTSGHYRKGHYRNGKWVSGSYVRGHYNSRPIYGYGLSSIDTSATDKGRDESSDPNLEQQNGINKDTGTSYDTELTGEAYLNSRRNYWRKEQKSHTSQLKTSKDKAKKDADWTTTWRIIIGVVILIAVFALVASGGPEVMNWFIAILVIWALLKKG